MQVMSRLDEEKASLLQQQTEDDDDDDDYPRFDNEFIRKREVPCYFLMNSLSNLG